MDAFLGLLGLFGVLVAIIMLIVKVLFKKGWAYKTIGILACVSFVLFVVALIITPMPEKTSYNSTTIEKPLDNGQIVNKKLGDQNSSTENAKDEKLKTNDIKETKIAKNNSVIKDDSVEESSSATKDSTAVEESSSATKDSTIEEDKPAVIPGLMSGDIKVNLEKTWGLTFSGPESGDILIQDRGETVDPDTGVTLMCNIFETSPLEIQWVDFIVNASMVAGIVDIDTINAVTEGYFGYCATLPYDNAEPEKAKEWVENNVSKATKAGNVIKAQFGPATFQMFGTEYFRTLRVTPNEE
ncbi:hypothetical protein [Tepidanaerobacter syntrophicus]|uniref:hypothetical protein n=1 Tax=Tepidanaerobacter syntrophicus TaxID=224999 RepID=UPI001BD5A7EF|nr:hypothetical protein [Tepidanaerobacter syntrophicus]